MAPETDNAETTRAAIAEALDVYQAENVLAQTETTEISRFQAT